MSSSLKNEVKQWNHITLLGKLPTKESKRYKSESEVVPERL